MKNELYKKDCSGQVEMPHQASKSPNKEFTRRFLELMKAPKE